MFELAVLAALLALFPVFVLLAAATSPIVRQAIRIVVISAPVFIRLIRMFRIKGLWFVRLVR